jgi:hypothetical protein
MMSSLVIFLAAAEPTFDLTGKLSTAPTFVGEFTQEKRVKGFKRPLTSRGTFVVKRRQGVTWTTTEPFPSVLSVSSDEIVSKQADTVVFRMSAEKDPGVSVVTHLLFSVLSGDLAVLSTTFTVDGTSDRDAWSVRLLPRPGPLAKVFSLLTLEGHEFVEVVTLREVTGDETRITLRHTRPQP